MWILVNFLIWTIKSTETKGKITNFLAVIYLVQTHFFVRKKNYPFPLLITSIAWLGWINLHIRQSSKLNLNNLSVENMVRIYNPPYKICPLNLTTLTIPNIIWDKILVSPLWRFEYLYLIIPNIRKYWPCENLSSFNSEVPSVSVTFSNWWSTAPFMSER